VIKAPSDRLHDQHGKVCRGSVILLAGFPVLVGAGDPASRSLSSWSLTS
jgi:hypothetical protein